MSPVFRDITNAHARPHTLTARGAQPGKPIGTDTIGASSQSFPLPSDMLDAVSEHLHPRDLSTMVHTNRELRAAAYRNVKRIAVGGPRALQPGEIRAQASRLPNLREIDLGNTLPGDDRRIAELAAHVKLERLHPGNCDRLSAAALAPAAALRHVKSVSLPTFPALRDTGLAPVRYGGRLEHLNLAGSENLTGSALRELGDQPRLRTLNISCCTSLVDDDLRSIAQKFPNLQELHIGANPQFSNKGYEHLAKLRGLRVLTAELNGSFDARALTAVGRISSLRVLKISGYPFGFPLPHGVHPIDDAALAHLGKLSDLEDLQLAHYRDLTGAGLDAVAKLPSLRRFALGGCDGVDVFRMPQALGRLWAATSPEGFTAHLRAHASGLTPMEQRNFWYRVDQDYPDLPGLA